MHLRAAALLARCITGVVTELAISRYHINSSKTSPGPILLGPPVRNRPLVRVVRTAVCPRPSCLTRRPNLQRAGLRSRQAILTMVIPLKHLPAYDVMTPLTSAVRPQALTIMGAMRTKKSLFKEKTIQTSQEIFLNLAHEGFPLKEQFRPHSRCNVGAGYQIRFNKTAFVSLVSTQLAVGT